MGLVTLLTILPFQAIKHEGDESAVKDTEMADTSTALSDDEDEVEDGEEGEKPENDDKESGTATTDEQAPDREMTDVSATSGDGEAPKGVEQKQPPANPLSLAQPNLAAVQSGSSLEGSPLKNVMVQSPTEPSSTSPLAAPIDQAAAGTERTEAGKTETDKSEVEKAHVEKPDADKSEAERSEAGKSDPSMSETGKLETGKPDVEMGDVSATAPVPSDEARKKPELEPAPQQAQQGEQELEKKEPEEAASAEPSVSITADTELSQNRMPSPGEEAARALDVNPTTVEPKDAPNSPAKPDTLVPATEAGKGPSTAAGQAAAEEPPVKESTEGEEGDDILGSLIEGLDRRAEEMRQKSAESASAAGPTSVLETKSTEGQAGEGGEVKEKPTETAASTEAGGGEKVEGPSAGEGEAKEA